MKRARRDLSFAGRRAHSIRLLDENGSMGRVVCKLSSTQFCGPSVSVTISVLKGGPQLIIQGTVKEFFANYIEPLLDDSKVERAFRSLAVHYGYIHIPFQWR
jgi:hypothetical protein